MKPALKQSWALATNNTNNTNNSMEMQKTLINRERLLAMIPLSERTIFNMEKRGQFPRRIQISPGRVGWDADEVAAWINARKSARQDAAS